MTGAACKSAAVSEINNHVNTYHVQEGGLPRVEVNVVDGHLQTTADGRSPNNLDNLPDC